MAVDWSKRATWHWAMALLVALSVAWIALSRADPVSMGEGAAADPLPRKGYVAPDLRLQTLNGEMVSLSDLRGQVVILNFWATWCPACRTEMPALDQVYRAYHDQGLEVVAVNVQEDPAGTEAFVQELGLDLPVLVDLDGTVSTRYRVTSLPTTYVIDRAGVIREVTVGGPLSRAYLASTVTPLLAEKGGE